MSAPRETRVSFPPARTLAARIVITALALVVWFWTQSLIGAKSLPASGLGDGLHTLLAPLNESLHLHPQFADGLLIVSSAFIDLFAIFLLGAWIFGRSVRPFLGLVLLLGLRQIFQALVALPPPPGMIWHYPGFPSLLVTYGVANDFFAEERVECADAPRKLDNFHRYSGGLFRSCISEVLERAMRPKTLAATYAGV